MAVAESWELGGKHADTDFPFSGGLKHLPRQFCELGSCGFCSRSAQTFWGDPELAVRTGLSFGRPEKPLAPVPAVTHGRTGGRVSSARPRGESWQGASKKKKLFLGCRGVREALGREDSKKRRCLTRRCSRWLSQDGNPSSPVVHLHLGERHHHPAPPAHAQHRSGAGVCWQDAEGRRHQIGAAHPVGGEPRGTWGGQRPPRAPR